MKQRLDMLLVERGSVPSREVARRMIMAGNVYVNGQKCDKAGQSVPSDAQIEIRGGEERYVSRGGYKLEKALAQFPIQLTGKTCMDIGASTGGFTDCMLQNGACKVYAVDVGYGQLAWKLRQDPRVVNLERTNVRYLTPEQVPQPAGFISIDVAFISLRLVLPALVRFLAPHGDIVALIKPQFEAGRENVGKKGVVRDKGIHAQVVCDIVRFSQQAGFLVRGLEYSPIKGPKGNIEYLVWLQRAGEAPDEAPCAAALDGDAVRELVARSHAALD